MKIISLISFILFLISCSSNSIKYDMEIVDIYKIKNNCDRLFENNSIQYKNDRVNQSSLFKRENFPFRCNSKELDNFININSQKNFYKISNNNYIMFSNNNFPIIDFYQENYYSKIFLCSIKKDEIEFIKIFEYERLSPIILKSMFYKRYILILKIYDQNYSDTISDDFKKEVDFCIIEYVDNNFVILDEYEGRNIFNKHFKNKLIGFDF